MGEIIIDGERIIGLEDIMTINELRELVFLCDDVDIVEEAGGIEELILEEEITSTIGDDDYHTIMFEVIEEDEDTLIFEKEYAKIRIVSIF